MEQEPRPLPMGAVVGDRFQVEELLGRGGFGIVYLVKDRLRDDLAVMKELAPAGSHRQLDDLLNLDALGAATAQHLRQRFIEEAKLMARLHLRGVPQVRSTLTDLGTAFFVSDFIVGAVTVDALLDRRGPLDLTLALDIVHQILDTLESLHEKGFLHRDLKPSNILVAESGEVYLLDFGAAREWHADAGRQHTVLFTPGYAPLEQLSERARRGPATDIYALCATAYHILSGIRPAAPPDRMNGVVLTPLLVLRPEVPTEIAQAIEAGLALSYADRPQTAAAFRDMLEVAEETSEHLSLMEMDAKLVQLQKLTFERRQCPSCRGILDEPKPLRKGHCPVCHESPLRRREIHDRLCPVCRISALRSLRNGEPLAICPLCTVGKLHRHRKGLFGSAFVAVCEECEARFEAGPGHMTLVDAGKSHTSVMIGTEAGEADWRVRSGRSEQIWQCDGCGAQLDEQPDGRRKLIVPKGKGDYRTLYPDEWARVASGLEPGAGNAFCPDCESDFFLEDDTITLLDCSHDPHGFAAENLGRLLTLEEVRWIGVGKDSPNPGYVCGTCAIEFDREGEYLRLIQTRNRKLMRFVGALHKLEDWHRAAQGLPMVADEDGFESRLESTLSNAYQSGELSFDNEGTVIWRGTALRDDDEVSAMLEITTLEVSHGGKLRKWRKPLGALRLLEADGAVLTFRVDGERESVVFEVEAVELVVELDSGRRTLGLTGVDLAARLKKDLSL